MFDCTAETHVDGTKVGGKLHRQANLEPTKNIGIAAGPSAVRPMLFARLQLSGKHLSHLHAFCNQHSFSR